MAITRRRMLAETKGGFNARTGDVVTGGKIIIITTTIIIAEEGIASRTMASRATGKGTLAEKAALKTRISAETGTVREMAAAATGRTDVIFPPAHV